MLADIVEEPPSRLHEYAAVSIAFDVRERVDVERIAVGADVAHVPVRAAVAPFVKDYDAIPGQRPIDWPDRWELSKWRFGAAYLDGQRVGGVAVVVAADELETAGADAAVLWDIRVRPDCRGRGIGRRLLAFAEAQARSHGRRRMSAETPDINVAACRFYAAAGYALAVIRHRAYPDLPDEAQLIWSKGLDPGA